MKRDWLEILACPICKVSLDLTVATEEEGEIITGSLRCSHCGDTYPIVDAIPNLLPKGLQEQD